MRGLEMNWRSASWKGSAWIAASALVVLVLTGAIPISAQRRVTTAAARRSSASPVFRTVAQLMADQAVRARVAPRPLPPPEFHGPDRRGPPPNPPPPPPPPPRAPPPPR